MSIDTIKNQIPEYAKDIKLNLSSLVNEETLTSQQLWGCLLSCAMAAGNAEVIRNIAGEAALSLLCAALDTALETDPASLQPCAVPKAGS